MFFNNVITPTPFSCCPHTAVVQVLEVVHAGVSKVLANKGGTSAHPIKKMTRMLTEKQAEAYLAAPAASKVFNGNGLDVEMNTRATSDEDVDNHDYFSGAAAQADAQQQQQLFSFLSSPRVRPVSVGPGGVASSSGSVSDPGCLPTMSGSAGRTPPRMFEEPEYGTAGEVYSQHMRNAISNPGTAPESLASSADLHVHGISSAAGGGKVLCHEAPSAVAVIGALQPPAADSHAVNVR